VKIKEGENDTHPIQLFSLLIVVVEVTTLFLFVRVCFLFGVIWFVDNVVCDVTHDSVVDNCVCDVCLFSCVFWFVMVDFLFFSVDLSHEQNKDKQKFNTQLDSKRLFKES
jgi:hypothetical protein